MEANGGDAKHESGDEDGADNSVEQDKEGEP